MIRWLIAVLGSWLIILFAAPTAWAALVTYNFVDVGDAPGTAAPGSNPFVFTGSFIFDTVTHTLSAETLQSTGDLTDNWVPTNGTTFNGGTTYDAVPIVAGYELFFASQSALFPTSDGDIVGFSLFDPLDGLSGDPIIGSAFFALNATTTLLGTDAAIQGCVAPVGVAIVVGRDSGVPTCRSADTSVPEPSSLALVMADLLSLVWLRRGPGAVVAEHARWYRLTNPHS